jgi:RNA polymerase sigma factor (sigma-70 family)
MMPARLRSIVLTPAVTRPDELPPRAGEAAALIERLFADYQTPILNYLYRLVGEAGLAEDLAQETFTRAWHACARLMAVDNPRGWLYRIATNAARDHLRRRRLIAWLPLFSSDDHLRDSGFDDKSIEAKQVRRALLGLKRTIASPWSSTPARISQ